MLGKEQRLGGSAPPLPPRDLGRSTRSTRGRPPPAGAVRLVGGESGAPPSSGRLPEWESLSTSYNAFEQPIPGAAKAEPAFFRKITYEDLGYLECFQGKDKNTSQSF